MDYLNLPILGTDCSVLWPWIPDFSDRDPKVRRSISIQKFFQKTGVDRSPSDRDRGNPVSVDVVTQHWCWRATPVGRPMDRRCKPPGEFGCGEWIYFLQIPHKSDLPNALAP